MQYVNFTGSRKTVTSMKLILSSPEHSGDPASANEAPSNKSQYKHLKAPGIIHCNLFSHREYAELVGRLNE